jgi:nucleoid-associated protein YgaU
MKFLLSIFLIFGLIGCSGSKSVNDVDENADGVELADADEFSDDADDAIEDELAEDETDESADPVTEEVSADDSMDMAPSKVEITAGEEGTYKVARNETLMMIAFKIYGDYERWRELAKLNSDTLNGSYTINSGMNLRYNMPSETFSWNPDGNPYLIKVGDTLGTISTDTYGKNKFWKNIWDNNKPLIKNPNRIFAGFTIYTPVIDGRDVANNE